MLNIKKYACRSVRIISLLFLSTLLKAQNAPFHGGFGRADSSIHSALLSCNEGRFSGGFGSGDSAIRTILLVCNDFRFSGNFGKGDSAIRTLLLVCNEGRFSGSFGKGDSSIRTTLITCNDFSFSGGFGRGDTAIFSNLLNCNSFRFSGDSADGFALTKTDLLNCNVFRFAGDSADGSALVTYIKPRDFLGNDTTVKIICTNDTYNLLGLYNLPGLTAIWSAANPSIASLGNYSIFATSQSGCKDTAQVLITQEIAKWNGSVSNNWHNAANWNNGKIPNEITHVIIPGGTANPCQIADADATAASVQAKNSGSFTIINNRKLVISGTCISLPAGQ
jgi:hypothetical protein